MRVFITLLFSFALAFGGVALNSANQKELTTLKGVGAKKAQSIIEYRKMNGCFKDVSEIAKVKGIGQKTFEKNRDNLELGKCSK